MDNLRVITVDIEIAKSIEDLPNGWKDAAQGKCGISSITLYDTHTGRYHVYMPTIYVKDGVVCVNEVSHLFEAVDHMNSADILVGWNNNGFDRRCIESYLGVKLTAIDYDILALVRQKVGYQKGWKLGEVAERNLGLQKTSNGAAAPELFKNGDMGRLIDYNINDVHLTRQLANLIRDEGCLIGPNGEVVEIEALECYA